MTDLSLCREPDLPGDLLLAVSLDLEALDCIGSNLSALSELESRPRLLFQLSNGSFLTWPKLPEGWRGCKEAAEGLSEEQQQQSGGEENSELEPPTRVLSPQTLLKMARKM